MEKEFVPFEQALVLKELGFDEPCFRFYNIKGVLIPEYVISKKQVDKLNLDKCCITPLYQQAFRWFREKYQIDSWIYPNLNGLYSVSNVRRGVGLGKVYEYQTYEEAELECLKKLIEIVKSKVK
jgi:hypothetical protein